MPVLVASYASLKRIETFLLLDEKMSDEEGADSETDSEKITMDDKLSPPTSSISLGDYFSPINMSAASFSWDPESEPFLKDVSLNLNQPQLYICVGSVASVRKAYDDCWCTS